MAGPLRKKLFLRLPLPRNHIVIVPYRDCDCALPPKESQGDSTLDDYALPTLETLDDYSLPTLETLDDYALPTLETLHDYALPTLEPPTVVTHGAWPRVLPCIDI